MPRSDRSLVAPIIFGLVATAFGLGCYITALNYPDPNGYQSYRYPSDDEDAARTTANVTGAYQYRTPCRDPKGNDESDLCAQWRAAEAAESSAWWTKLGFFTALFGIIGLYWQINLTRRAVEDTGEATEAMREANRIAQENAAIENRPFLYLLKVTHEEDEIAENVLRVRFCFHIFNSGKLPAYNLAVDTSAVVAGLLSRPEPAYDSSAAYIPNCPPGVARMVFATAVVNDEYFGMFKAGFAAIFLVVKVRFDSRTIKDKTIIEERRATRDGMSQGIYYMPQPLPEREASFDFGEDDDWDGDLGDDEGTANDGDGHPAEG